MSGLIERIAQTGGPTIFVISDGTGTLALKGFIGQGQRAYPDLKEGNTIRATVTINEYNQELEREIKEIPFLVKSPVLEKLKPLLIKAASEIRLAIIQSRPIIVRHHNDTDGYCSGYALEKAILPLIEKEHGSEKASYEFFNRSPSQAPFYEIDDSIRDTAASLRNVAKFSKKMPLIIITDNGSTPEDLFAIKQGKIHGAEFIVVDHHFFDEDVISKEVLTHISPFLVGEDGAKFSAGMLGAELARLINNIPGFGFYPKPGKCVGMSHDDIQNTKGIDNLVTADLMNTAITLRATDKSNFSMHELIKNAAGKIVNALVAVVVLHQKNHPNNCLAFF